MVPAVFDDTRVRIKAGEYGLSASGSVKKFDGFLTVYDIVENNDNNDKEDSREENMLPELSENENLKMLEIIPQQHFTQPPPAFSDATLIKALEEKDIGRPSTYAPIISTLVYRRYIDRDRSKFIPTELGIVVSGILAKSFSGIISEEFTAQMEDKLDGIEEGTTQWKDLIKEFYFEFEKLIEAAAPHIDDIKKDIEGETGEVCEKCGGKMIIKWGRHGKFMSCEKYPECKNAKGLGEGGAAEEKIEEKCPECGNELLIKTGPYGKFIACSKYPDCRYTKQIIIKAGVACPDCGGDVIERTFKRFRKFYGCGNYPKCKFMVWDKPVPEPCPKCGAPFMLEKWKKNSVTLYCRQCDHKQEKEKAEDS